uniref:BHLH domain-containing protein n=1 Tax=Globisporangium ultimum (strain ATCC 200006 / CBS 805.95 / DAOM BR144) TaxID=431595 RepID=K3WWG3_GLOUD
MMDLHTHTAKWTTSKQHTLLEPSESDDDLALLLPENSDRKLAARLEDDASSMVLMMLLPDSAQAASLSEEEQQAQLSGADMESPFTQDDDDLDDALWTASHGVPFELIDADDNSADHEPLLLLDDDDDDEEMLLAPGTSAAAGEMMAMGSFQGAGAAPGKKKRGRKPSMKPKEKKPKRPPPTAAKARLRNYERRSRNKRENTMLSMKNMVGTMEAQITQFCRTQRFDDGRKQQLCDLALEAITLHNQNYHLRKAIDDHKFFHSMLQLEYEHRETSPMSASDFSTPRSWTPLKEEACFGFIRKSYLEIESFSSSEDFVSSGLEICGWREKRKLCGKDVKFQFHKRFARDCGADLAMRSWEMRAVQDQSTRYFGPFLNVQVEVIQRIADDVVVVRRKITHTQDNWVHHTIYLLFRTETPDGHLVCIRDMNPEETRDMNVYLESTSPKSCVIWSNCFIWWKFTTLPKTETQPIGGFEVEYGGSLSSATSADAAFWMREVLLCALRWENLVVGPLLTV